MQLPHLRRAPCRGATLAGCRGWGRGWRGHRGSDSHGGRGGTASNTFAHVSPTRITETACSTKTPYPTGHTTKTTQGQRTLIPPPPPSQAPSPVGGSVGCPVQTRRPAAGPLTAPSSCQGRPGHGTRPRQQKRKSQHLHKEREVGGKGGDDKQAAGGDGGLAICLTIESAEFVGCGAEREGGGCVTAHHSAARNAPLPPHQTARGS